MDLRTKFLSGAVILLIVVLAQNTGAVVFQFLFWQVSMSKVMLAPLLILIGGFIGFFIGKNSWNW